MNTVQPLIAICGYCDQPANDHTTINEHKHNRFACSRDVLDIAPTGTLSHRDHEVTRSGKVPMSVYAWARYNELSEEDQDRYLSNTKEHFALLFPVTGKDASPRNFHYIDTRTQEWSDYYVTDASDYSTVVLMPDTEGAQSGVDKDPLSKGKAALVMHGIAYDRAAPAYDGGTESELMSNGKRRPIAMPDGMPLTGIGASDYDDPNESKWLKELDRVEAWKDATFETHTSAKTGTVTKSYACTRTLEEFLAAPLDQQGRKVFDPEVSLTIKRNPKWKQAYATIEPLSADPQFISHNAYIEGFDGFSTTKELDLNKTLRHHQRLLNVFRNKHGNMQVGGVEILYHPTEPKVMARCVQNKCPGYSIETLPDLSNGITDESRDIMEQFVMKAIAHGNNHAAYWFRTRVLEDDQKRPILTTKGDKVPLWYKVHHTDCKDVSTCDKSLPYCPDRITMDERIAELVASFAHVA